MSIFDPTADDGDVIDQVMREPIDPAVFPACIVRNSDRGQEVEYGRGGLRMRDYFAAHVIGGLMASDAASQQTRYTAARLAERAYMVADAMIVARGLRPVRSEEGGGHAG